jgi:hypothetical protein
MIAVLAINLPWMVIFASGSKVMQVIAAKQQVDTEVGTDSAPDNRFRQGDADIKTIFATLREYTISTNPLIVLLLIPALVQQRTPRLLTITLCWLAFLGTLGNWYKPQLELNRMLLLFSLLAVLPVSQFIADQLKYPKRSTLSYLALGALALIPYSIYRVVTNDTTERFYRAEPLVAELTEAIKQHAGDGRVLFAGFILHELSNGHIAPLAALTGVPLIARSYQHDRWQYEDIIPEYYRRREPQGIFEYLDLMNVSAVITHDRGWARWFGRRPERFTQVWQAGRFRLFKRLDPLPGYFYSGSGDVLSQTPSSVRFSLKSTDAVLKFNYLPQLTVAGCQISPLVLPGEIALIALSNCDGREVYQLMDKGPLSRLPIWSRVK